MFGRAITVGAGLLIVLGSTGAAEPLAYGKWTLASGEDAATFTAVAALWQNSVNSIKDEYASKDVIPQLVFRCRPGDPTVIASIDWGRFISSFTTELGFTVDAGKRKWRKWSVDRSEKITISPSAVDTQLLLDQLRDGTQLEVRISPYSEGPVNAHFDLGSFDQAVEELRANCQ
jgi:hypothetical protein